MHGEFNGLKALILNNYRYAYYVHYFSPRIQLALVAKARKVAEVHQFFKDLSNIVSIASASSKRHDGLQKAQVVEITRFVSIDELATRTRMNHIGTLQRPGETLWSSHLNPITSLLTMYNTTSTILENLKKSLLTILDMNAQYIVGRSRNKKEDVTMEHHYQPHTAVSDVPVSSADSLVRRSHGRVSPHGLHTGSPHARVASTVSFSAFAKMQFQCNWSTHLVHFRFLSTPKHSRTYIQNIQTFKNPETNLNT
ncbi:hypothetical protein J1N35_045118 [Gossypium stocksii]|uniref:Uncharacterized protein n=1 Tax=Gossypium stocksii TaxID=47602 RepID=A0A9D3ZG89_9ROSI|nr:hypothetical protein J1N35_045118 [Gossypium stocksii]